MASDIFGQIPAASRNIIPTKNALLKWVQLPPETMGLYPIGSEKGVSAAAITGLLLTDSKTYSNSNKPTSFLNFKLCLL